MEACDISAEAPLNQKRTFYWSTSPHDTPVKSGPLSRWSAEVAALVMESDFERVKENQLEVEIERPHNRRLIE